MATTAAPYFLTKGSTRSNDSSSPVTEFNKALPLYTFKPASRASIIDESIANGTSTNDCTSSMVCAKIAGSSAKGIPALTSNTVAPAATCAKASASTRLKSPFFISSANNLRPVGLMRSPITAKGRSKPLTTSLVAELIIVSVMIFSY